MKRRVVITGIGVISPIGIGPQAFWEGLSTGRSGIDRLTCFDASTCPTQIAAEIRDFDPKEYVQPRKALKVMARDIQLSVSAAALAMEDCQVRGKVDPTRFGASIGASFISSELQELGVAIAHARDGAGQFDIRKFGKEGMERLFPLWLLKYLPNMLACHVSIIHDAQGPSNSITTGCAAAMQAIGEGCRVIERNAADVMICGGAESKLNPLGMIRQMLYAELSCRNDEPQKACRPFDRDRNGTVVGEGAGIVVLEELSHARRRGAKIYAEVAGYGSACDTMALNGKERTAQARVGAMRAALADGGLTPEDIGYVSAHGLGTRVNDRLEAEAIRTVLGQHAPKVPVSSMKSMMGHLGAAAGGAELIGCILAMANSLAPPTLNCDQPEDEFRLDFVPNRAREARIDAALCNTASLAGQVATIAIKRFRE